MGCPTKDCNKTSTTIAGNRHKPASGTQSSTVKTNTVTTRTSSTGGNKTTVIKGGTNIGQR